MPCRNAFGMRGRKGNEGEKREGEGKRWVTHLLPLQIFSLKYIYIYIYSRGGGREDLRGVGRGTIPPQNLLF